MRWGASGDIRAVFALCDNGEIRGVIVRNVLRCFAQTVIMQTRKKKQQINKLKSLMCRSGVSSRRRCLLVSYDSAHRLPENVTPVRTLSNGWRIAQITKSICGCITAAS